MVVGDTIVVVPETKVSQSSGLMLPFERPYIDLFAHALICLYCITFYVCHAHKFLQVESSLKIFLLFKELTVLTANIPRFLVWNSTTSVRPSSASRNSGSAQIFC